jgi:hypothetical protein
MIDVHRADVPGVEADKPTEIPAAGWWQVIRRAWAEAKADQVPLLAAGVAFFGFLSVFPAIVAAVLTYGLVADPGQIRGQVQELTAAMPASGRELLLEQLDALTSAPRQGLGIGVALAVIAATVARAVGDVSVRLVTARSARRRLTTGAAAFVVLLGALLPAASVVTGYQAHDQSRNREADAWVASVHEALPPNAVLISWWSYSTPLWYHRWVLGERPDVTIIDERDILDDGYRTMHNAIRAYFGTRPVYVVPPHWEYERIVDRWRTETVSTYPGYTDLLMIEGRR